MVVALPRILGLVALAIMCSGCGDAASAASLESAPPNTTTRSSPTACSNYGDEACLEEALNDSRDAELEQQKRAYERELQDARERGYDEGYADGRNDGYPAPSGGTPWWATVKDEPLDMSGFYERSEKMDALTGRN
jgi:hypothetical protein